ncbi:MAG TPA: cytochrome c [Flavipsychrobacter sp.]|nr:cytochrome c [Flavipsychrobacter sp.]
MKKLITLLSVCGAIVLLTQCSPKIPASFASTATTPAGKVDEVKKHYTDDQVAQGKVIFQSNCAKCHKLKLPETRTVDQWEQILPSMVHKAKLSSDDAGMVRAYLLENAKMS